MPDSLACLAPRLGDARRAAAEIAERAPATACLPARPRLSRRSRGASSRVVLCAVGPPDRDLEFLRAVAERLLWPPVPDRLREAIGGLRTPPSSKRDTGLAARNPVRRREPSAALLMEGLIDERRARAALLSSGPTDWVVESARHVRISRPLARDPRAGRDPVVRPRSDRSRGRPRLAGPGPSEDVEPVVSAGNSGLDQGAGFQIPDATKILSSSGSTAPRRASAARISSDRSSGTARL